MNAVEFKTKWGRYKGKETSGYQEHFNDLCAMLGVDSPAKADPTGEESFCFQKRVVKDAELFVVREESAEYGDDAKRGYADVWKKDCFAWEYKGRKKNLDEAYKQLLRYRESLLNPPILVVCDFDRFIIRTNFNGTVQETWEFKNDEIDQSAHIRRLRAIFTDPSILKPQQTTDRVTEQLAEKIAEVAKSLNKRECIEYSNARRRAQVNHALRKNLRVARFLNRIIFCFFAEDVGLLPDGTFTEVTTAGLDDPHFFAERLEELFRVMAKGGSFGSKKIRRFNGHLFDEATVFELTTDEVKALAEASEADWQYIEPSILGTLFERALDENQRSQLGAHYTSKADIETLVEPVLMAPLRRTWKALKKEHSKDYALGKGSPDAKKEINAFLKELRSTVVLDPACGSGNFLYVSLQKLLGLEKDVLAYAEQLGFEGMRPGVSVQQLRAIEINPYAYELAQVAVQIGHLQWLRDNGFALDKEPVLENLEGFENADALLREVFKRQPKDLKEARDEEHSGEQGLKAYVEREWPDCNIIVGNPPFLGNKKLMGELGETYSRWLFDVFADRLPATSDFCCYWFEKARSLMETGRCTRAGLLATKTSCQVSSRRAFERIASKFTINFAISDRVWFDQGVAIRICMVGFARKSDNEHPILDQRSVVRINADLTAGIDLTAKSYLGKNGGKCFMGITKVGDFDISLGEALVLLSAPNASGQPNSDVLRPFKNGSDIVRSPSDRWIIDFGVNTKEQDAAKYEAPFKHVAANVRPFRLTNNRQAYREQWWIHAESRPGYRLAVSGLGRYLATARVAKHRVFVWLSSEIHPDSKVIAVAVDTDYFLGLLHSRPHECWTLATCGWHGVGNDATYNPRECFETFPFPAVAGLDEAGHVLPGSATPATVSAIAAAARELNDLRERWLNPPEWTTTEVLEFPGTVGGPWDRFIDKASIAHQPSTMNHSSPLIGTVRYPRLVPKDADCAKKLKDRTLTKLYNERPAWLDFAHKKLDAAVAAAYGWPADISDDDILAKLLELNLARAAAEAKSTPKARRPQRAKAEDELI